jgi:uncharacterized protein YfaS (alpha-2-macroglobulin family)
MLKILKMIGRGFLSTIRTSFAIITWPVRFSFRFFIGRFSWEVPTFVTLIARGKNLHPRSFWSVFSLLLLWGVLFLGYQFYQNFWPQPLQVMAVVDAPNLVNPRHKSTPSPLIVRFQYNRKIKTKRPIPSGYPSVAPLEQIDKTIVTGIKLFPDMAGTWKWIGDNRLRFMPKQKWPASQEYKVSFDPNVFSSNVLIKELEYQFSSPIFKETIKEFNLYQDPVNKKIRRLVSTIKFTHAVDEASLKEKINLYIKGGKALSFNLKMDEYGQEAYITSEPVSLEKAESYAHLQIDEGIRSLDGMAETDSVSKDKVRIPDLYSFLKVKQFKQHIVRNEKNEPEQILTLQFSDHIHIDELKRRLKLYLLGTQHQYWNMERVNKSDPKDWEKIPYKIIPNTEEYSTIYNLKIDEDERRYLYMEVERGLNSFSDFLLSSTYRSLNKTPEYPKEVNISGEGSVVSSKGAKTVGFTSRGMKALKVELYQILDQQLNHLVSQTNGNMMSPSFKNYNFDEDNISRKFETILHFGQTHPKTLNFASLSLNKYLKRKQGVFLIKTYGWDPDKKRLVSGSKTQRLFVVTDLGVIVKKTADGRQQVFVQSLKSGAPVAGAKVMLIGKNGLPIFDDVTNAQGVGVIANPSGYRDGQTPIAFIVEHQNDTVFLPYNQQTRQIDYSKFDVAGEYASSENKKELKGFLFSDRGIYRPGENIHIGSIVKQKNFNVQAGLPLQFQIKDPRGNKVFEKAFKLSEMGLDEFSFQSELTSLTGRYQGQLYLINKKGYRQRQLGNVEFKVEEFQPDTLKIVSKFKLEKGELSSGWMTSDKVKGLVELKNLFGTPAQKRKVIGQLDLIPVNFSFSQYKGYRFLDPLKNNLAQQGRIVKSLPSTTTDDDGNAIFDISLVDFEKGTYQLKLTVEGFTEGGGRSVTANSQLLVSPLDVLVGHKADGALGYLKKGQERNVNFIAINPRLESHQLTGLKIKLIHKQAVSSLVQQRNGTFSYETVVKNKLMSEADFKIEAKGMKFRLDTDEAGDFEIQLLNKENDILSKLNYSVVAKGNQSGRLEKNAELSLKLNKKDYSAGDEIELNIVAPYQGAGLITIETNDVHAYKWFKTSTNSHVDTIKIPHDLEGNAYVNVSFLRSVDSKEIFTSPLSYAVQSFNIDRSKRQVDIDLSVPKLARPGKPMKIEFKTDKPARIQIFAVDEGILQVAKYQTPRPLDHFLKKSALQVRTYQILDLLLPEYKLLQAAAGIGGGAAQKLLGANLNPFARTVDRPAVFWSGTLDANSNKNEVSFDIPDSFSGNLKVMAVAVSDSAMGATATSTVVRGAFVLSPNVLTVAAPGDEFEITLGVANLVAGSGKQAKVKIELQSNERLEVSGEHSATLVIDENSEGRVSFKVKVKEALGEGKLTFTAKLGNESTTRTSTMSIRPVEFYQTRVMTGYESDGDHDIHTTREMYPELSEQTVSASSSPLMLVGGLQAYLNRYPHGCTEQIISQSFPLIALKRTQSVDEQNKSKKKVQSVIERIQGRQMSGGGFSLWPGASSVSNFSSIYATHFMIEAKQQSVPMPRGMLDSALDYMRVLAKKQVTGLQQARQRAMAIYLLARNESVPTGDLVDLHSTLTQGKLNWKTDITAMYIASTYELLKKKKVALEIVEQFEFSDRVEDGTDFQSNMTVNAQYVYLLSKHFKGQAADLNVDDTIMPMIKPLLKGHLNTISSSYIVSALNAYDQNVASLKDAVTLTDSKGAIMGFNLAKSSMFNTADIPLTEKEVAMTAEHPLFYQYVAAGFDKPTTVDPANNGLEVIHHIVDEHGDEVTQLQLGQEANIRIRIRTLDKDSRSNIAVVDLLPGGFEVIRSSIPRSVRGWSADYVDTREDRVIFYGSFASNVTELTYKIKATSAGAFSMPPAYGESMYDAEVFSRSKAGKITVSSQP